MAKINTVAEIWKLIIGSPLSEAEKLTVRGLIDSQKVIEEYLLPQTLSILAGAVTLNASSGPNANLNLTADVTTFTIIPEHVGQSGTIRVTRDAVDAWTITNSNSYTVSSGDLADVATLTAITGEIIITWFSYNGTDITLFVGGAS